MEPHQPEMRELIKKTAVRIFSQKGYNGTSIREIAGEAGCSLPMLYYYFQNKYELYSMIAVEEFTKLVERLNQAIPRNIPLVEMYITAIKQRQELSEYDKAVYKLALKVYLGFEDNEDLVQRLRDWEGGRWERNKIILFNAWGNTEEVKIKASILIRVVENLIERIILLDENISEDTLRAEISAIFEL